MSAPDELTAASRELRAATAELAEALAAQPLLAAPARRLEEKLAAPLAELCDRGPVDEEAEEAAP